MGEAGSKPSYHPSYPFYFHPSLFTIIRANLSGFVSVLPFERIRPFLRPILDLRLFWT